MSSAVSSSSIRIAQFGGGGVGEPSELFHSFIHDGWMEKKKHTHLSTFVLVESGIRQKGIELLCCFDEVVFRRDGGSKDLHQPTVIPRWDIIV